MTKIQSCNYRMAIKQFFVLISHIDSKLKINKTKLSSSIFFLKVIKGLPGKIPSSKYTTVNYMKIHSKNRIASI